jgi:CHAT domain-containing protein/tetratricopeptide (TPR) repeat protein
MASAGVLLLWTTLSASGVVETVAPAAERLQPGPPLERRLEAGEVHRYSVALASGEVLRVAVHPQDFDVAIRILDPSGQTVLDVDTPSDALAVEEVVWIAGLPGAYGVEVRALQGSGESAYRVELSPPHPAGATDRRLAEAGQAAAAAHGKLIAGKPEDLEQALALYGTALETWTGLGDDARQAAVLHWLGLVHLRRGTAQEALPLTERALALRRALGDRRGMAKSLGQRGRIFRTLGDHRAAVGAYSEAIALMSELGDPGEEALLQNNLGFLFHGLGEMRQAQGAYERALELCRQTGNQRLEAVILNNLGGVLATLGQPIAAVEHHEQALELARSLGRRELEAEALNNLGTLASRLGQPLEAAERFSAALAIFEERGDKPNQATTLTNLGSLLVELGAAEEGRELLQRALPLHRDPSKEAVTRIALSRAAEDLGRPAEALEILAQISTQLPEDNRLLEALTLQTRGFLLISQGQARQAEELLQRAVSLQRSAGDKTGEAISLRGLGKAYAALGKVEAAASAFEKAIDLAALLGDPAEHARLLKDRARWERAQGNLETARRSLETSLDLLESLRSEVTGASLRASHLATAREVYEMYVDVLLQLREQNPAAGLDSLAFETAERARARGILDFLGQARVDVREGEPALLAEERRLRLEMNAKAALRTDQGAAALEKDLTALAAEYQILEARLQASSPRYARLKQPEVRLAAIQREALDGDTVLLEYFLAEPRSYVWIVTSGSLASFELPGRAHIEELVRRVHERLGRLDPTEASQEREELRELSRILLGPVLDRLKGRRVAIVADGALHYLPFPVLPVPASDGSGAEVPLVVEHEVVHLPSAAVLRELRRSREERPRPPAALAVLADPIFEKDDPRIQTVAQASTPAPSPEPPPSSLLASLLTRGGEGPFARLPWTRKEAEVITAEAAGRDVLLALDARASRDLATAGDLGRYRILHFATHGVLDSQRPALSALVLSQVDERGQARDGFLRLHDVYHLRLNADLVVLSGCETALGKTLRGEGIIGLTRGFFHAGASQVMASLWPVRDRATAELMQRTYRGMFRDGLLASAALRQAQASMWRERQWRDPYFWAAFVLQGDWRAGR